MKRSSRITIHPKALQHNLKCAKQAAPNSKTLAVIKADAYGHGAVATAGILYELADAFAVSCIPEAVELREAGISKPITILQGHQNIDDLRIAAHYGFRLTVHDVSQLAVLDTYSFKHQFDINLKIDTGMHRLGFQPDQAEKIYSKLKKHAQVDSESLIMMTHLSSADELEKETTIQQLECFEEACKNIPAPQSIANSAGILGWDKSHVDWIRPGIMLYGGFPFAKHYREVHELKAAMTLSAPVISVHNLKKGDCIGYAGSWQCPNDMTVAVIACGYADGYPRHAKSDTPVWINGKEAQLVGRVSMDMIVIDINDFEDNVIRVGDLAELWGENLSVDRVAESAETIAYELLCNAGTACEQAGT